MLKKRSILTKLYSVLSLFFLFVLITLLGFQPHNDPDFGWHYRTGEYILKNHRVPQQDIFSFSLPNHPYIAYSWLTDIFVYKTFNLFGHSGLILFYASIISLAILFGQSTIKIPRYQTISRFFTLALVPFALLSIGLRTQVVSVLGTAMIFFLSAKQKPPPSSPIFSQKWFCWLKNSRLVFLPIVFSLWVNLHAGYSLGLAVLTIQFILTLFFSPKNKKTKTFKSFLMIWMICLIATLANPYGFRLHQLIYQMVTNTTSAASNLDWVPYLQSQAFSFRHKILTLFWSVTVFTFLKNQIRYRIFIFLFLILSLTSSRYLMPLALVLLLTTPQIISNLIQKFLPSDKASLALTLLIAVFIFWFFTNLSIQVKSTKSVHQSEEKLAQIGNFPYHAVQKLQNMPHPLNVFNFYDWGGYLAYQVPHHRVFINGRMDNYFKDGHSFKTEHDRIVFTRSNWQELFQNYPIEAVLVPTISKLPDNLITQDWQIIYQDDSSTLLFHPRLKP